MNETFNFKRFANYFFRNMKSSFKHLLIMAAFNCFVTSVIICFLSFTVGEFIDALRNKYLFEILLYASTCIFTSLILSEQLLKGSMIRFLLIPVSTFEKYIAKFLLSLVVYPVAFVICYYLSFHFAKIFSPAIATTHYIDLICLSSFQLVSLLCLLHSIYFFGSILFKGNSFVKTCFLSIAVVGLIDIIAVVYHKSPDGKHVSFNSPDSLFYAFRLNSSVAFQYGILIAAVLWLVTFFVFKRKHI
jgi:hypothetical protein